MPQTEYSEGRFSAFRGAARGIAHVVCAGSRREKIPIDLLPALPLSARWGAFASGLPLDDSSFRRGLRWRDVGR